MRMRRKMQKKRMTRPRKSATQKAKRQRVHKKRLVALGVAEEKVAKMDAKVVRTMLRKPAKVVADK